VTRIGVVGAGTMGAGIAQISITSGFEVVLCDAAPDALERAVESIGTGIRKGRERGRWQTDEATAIAEQLTLAGELDALAVCDVVIEAAPEQLELKQQLLSDLARLCPSDAILASNTSSIPLTAIAAGTPNPSQVVGLHFFNPVPLMGLVEVIAAEQSSEQTVARATEIGKALGKRAILAPDSPGFLVNRCGRAFYGEPFRILGERIAAPQQIDRICRIAGGFRMGPFELMDLVGIDVGFAVARSFTELSFGEPRWRPTILQSRMAASGRFGRKTGQGWYTYDGGPHRPDDPLLPEPGDGGGRELVVIGTGTAAHRMRKLAENAGFSVGVAPSATAIATIFADPGVEARDIVGVPCPIVSCGSRSLASRRIRTAVGFNVPNLAGHGRLVELARTSATPSSCVEVAVDVFTTTGAHTEWVGDGPGLVLDRVLAQIVNEAMFAFGEGLATAEDIDAGVVLGLNYPRGSLTWGAELGWSEVLDTLDGIWQERREERYRPAPALIAAAAGEPIGTGA
jgi:3-hydroxybutyryl-CoA dehydrogenase